MEPGKRGGKGLYTGLKRRSQASENMRRHTTHSRFGGSDDQKGAY
jgi:hypothetical protein